MESAVLRTEKAIGRDGEEKAAQKILYTQIFTQEAFIEIEQAGKRNNYCSCRRR